MASKCQCRPRGSNPASAREVGAVALRGKQLPVFRIRRWLKCKDEILNFGVHTSRTIFIIF